MYWKSIASHISYIRYTSFTMRTIMNEIILRNKVTIFSTILSEYVVSVYESTPLKMLLYLV